MTQPAPIFVTVIHQRGFRVTPQRQLILDAVREGNGHSSPNEIYQRIQARIPAVNRTTVYRNLNFLCEIRLVVAAQIGGHLYYELAGSEPHHHLICRKCNQVYQLNHTFIKSLFDQIDREQSFLIDMDHVAFFGICQRCRNNEALTSDQFTL